jgi:hypothetical protein
MKSWHCASQPCCRLPHPNASILRRIHIVIFHALLPAPKFKPHRLKPVLLDPSEPVLCPRAVEWGNGYDKIPVKSSRGYGYLSCPFTAFCSRDSPPCSKRSSQEINSARVQSGWYL